MLWLSFVIPKIYVRDHEASVFFVALYSLVSALRSGTCRVGGVTRMTLIASVDPQTLPNFT